MMRDGRGCGELGDGGGAVKSLRWRERVTRRRGSEKD